MLVAELFQGLHGAKLHLAQRLALGKLMAAGVMLNNIPRFFFGQLFDFFPFPFP
jgi:hypothetical protein